MTLDEAIKHCLEVAEQKERDSAELIDILDELDVDACKECAADHRQLAEWLTELKELRGLVAASDVLAKDVLAVDTLCKQILEYKRLLKLALQDMNGNNICDEVNACNACKYGSCVICSTFEWQYTDEALKLIGDD